MKLNSIVLNATLLALAGTTLAQDKPYTATPAAAATNAVPSGTIERLMTAQLPEVFAKGKFNLNTRLRYELADAQNLLPSHAFTLRTRFGFTTAPLHGLQGMIEGENISVIGDRDNFNAAGTTGAGKTVIPDPEVTQLNQAWLGFTHWNSTVKGGRQRIALDNHRFVGDVGWRQNMQTFDALTFESKALTNLNLFYGYLWEVNRVFGDVSGLAAGNRDFQSDSHLLNASYTGLPFGKLTAYAYLLSFGNSAANSSATYGLCFAGSRLFDKETNFKANYRAEYAHQGSYRNQPLAYDADYFNLEASADYQRFNLGAGHESLGSDGGAKSFSTPLATLHAFNGWADLFLNTPATGLRDVYAFAGVKLPGNIPLRVIYHQFDSDFGSTDFGHEWDVVASRTFGKHWTALAKYAYFDGKGALNDTQKIWFQIEFNF